MKFPIKDFLSKCDQIRNFLDLVTFTEEILNGKLYFLCSDFSPVFFFYTPVRKPRSTEMENWAKIGLTNKT